MRKIYGIGMAVMLSFGAFSAGAIAQDSQTEQQKDFSKIGAGMGTFLNLPVGARATGMGGGFVGVADDPTALYWNAAGITQTKGVTAAYSYTSLFAGMTQNFAGVTLPVGESYKLGLSANSYGSDDIAITTMEQQDGTGEKYSVRDLALGLSFAGQLTDQFSFGVTGKFVSLAFATQNANGVAFDVGTLYKPGILGMRIGFAVQNLSTPLQYHGNGLVQTGGFDPVTGYQKPDVELQATEASLPLTFRAGISSDVMEGDATQSLLVGTEFSTASDRGEYLSIGGEYVWNNLISARAGYQIGTNEAFGLSGGLGLRYQTGGFLGQIDYAVRPHKTMGLVNQVSASIWFN